MRIVTRKKLYRAFPELDPFTDRECELFVQRVKNATGRMVVVRVTTALVTLIAFPLVAIGLFILTEAIDRPLRTAFGWRLADVLTGAVWIIGLSGLPLLLGLLLRDVMMQGLLRNAIRVRIERIRCLECRYPLLGQTAVNDTVRCPECGTKMPLRVLGLDSPDDLLPQELP